MNDAFDIILFGGSGDLALRKLVPALYRAGTWGPEDADRLIADEGRAWFNGQAKRSHN